MLLTVNQLKKAERAESAEELYRLAVAENIDITRSEAEYFYEVLRKSHDLPDEDMKDVPGGGRVDGNSFHVSGDTPLYSVGMRMRCMIWNGDVIGYVKCELLQVSSRRLGKTMPEYAYYIRFLEDVWCADIRVGKTRWVWESKLRNTGTI